MKKRVIIIIPEKIIVALAAWMKEVRRKRRGRIKEGKIQILI